MYLKFVQDSFGSGRSLEKESIVSHGISSTENKAGDVIRQQTNSDEIQKDLTSIRCKINNPGIIVCINHARDIPLLGVSTMERSDLSKTSTSLLGRLKGPSDELAWSEFFSRYTPKILKWCRTWNIQEADANDVSQAVLIKLVERMSTFEYDGSRSFRAYLKTLTHYAVCDSVKAHIKPGQGAGGSDVIKTIESVEARDDLARLLEDQFDHELMSEAMKRVSNRVEPRTWRAFELLTIDGLSGSEVASRLEMKVATVFVSKSKVLKMLREEVALLEQI